MTSALFRITGAKWKDIVFHWDWPAAVIVGVLMVVLPNEEVLEAVYIPLIVTEIGAASAVLGFTLTGMSIIAATMDDDLVIFFDSVGAGIVEDLWPFWYTALITVIAVIIGITSIAVLSDCGMLARQLSLGFVSAVTSYAVLNVLLIIAYLAGHARDRARYLRLRRQRSRRSRQR